MTITDTTSTPHPCSRYDAVLLAGDSGASHAVCGRNKSFLELNGAPLFCHVLSALQQVARIERVCIVGPRGQIERALDSHQGLPSVRSGIHLCEQGESLLHNVWKGFLHLCPEAREAVPPFPSALSEKAVLYISGDLPLVTPFEIDTFLNLCDLTRFDYCLGMVSAEHLRFFRPRQGTPGISTHFFHIREGRFRQNNLHLVKPLRVARREHLQKVYDFRYQRDLRNILRLAQEFIKVGVGLKGLWCYGLLHWNQLLSRLHLSPLTLPTRALLPLSLLEHCISRALGTRFGVTISPLAGAVLDIDNEYDYRAMQAMFVTWQRYLADRENEPGRKTAPPAPPGAEPGSRVA